MSACSTAHEPIPAYYSGANKILWLDSLRDTCVQISSVTIECCDNSSTVSNAFNPDATHITSLCISNDITEACSRYILRVYTKRKDETYSYSTEITCKDSSDIQLAAVVE